MPRQSRMDAPGALQQVIVRGIARKAIFKDDADRTELIERLAYSKASRRKYRQFVEKGIGAGRLPELVGGGLIRSIGGWKMAKIRLKGQDRVNCDERILGDGEFVQSVLDRCHEDYPRRQRRVAQGVDLKTLSHGVADYFNLSDDRLFTPGRYPAVVQARSVFCFLAVRELGLTATELAGQMGLTQPAISMSVKRSAGIVKEKKLRMDDFKK